MATTKTNQFTGSNEESAGTGRHVELEPMRAFAIDQFGDGGTVRDIAEDMNGRLSIEAGEAP